jgi:hypothetical protein
MRVTKTKQAERIIIGLLGETSNVTIAQAKEACGKKLPVTFALWNLRTQRKLNRVAPGTYKAGPRLFAQMRG